MHAVGTQVKQSLRWTFCAVLVVAFFGSLGIIVAEWPLPFRVWISLVVTAGASLAAFIAFFLPNGLNERWKRGLTAGAACIGIVAAVVAVPAMQTAGNQPQESQTEKASDNSSSPSAAAPSTTCSIPPTPHTSSSPPRVRSAWQATVVNTWSLSRCKDLGIRPRVSPLGSKLLYPGFFTGTSVYVTCYYPRGVEITDKDTRKSSTVWYKLEDKHWLSAMFLQIGKRPGVSPPPSMPICRGVK